VNIASSAGSQLVNSVTVSGGGAASVTTTSSAPVRR
jgi:hypothetical protein